MMYELIYLDESESREPLEAAILQKFPDAKFEDASDEIHWNRFEVEIPNATEREFFHFAVTEGFAGCCLCIRLMLRINPPEWLKEELGQLKAAKAKAGGA